MSHRQWRIVSAGRWSPRDHLIVLCPGLAHKRFYDRQVWRTGPTPRIDADAL